MHLSPSIRRTVIPCLAILLAAPSPAETTRDLSTEAHKLAEVHLKAMGDDYVARIDNHRRLIFISALDEEHLRQTQLLLSAVMDAQRKNLFRTELSWNLVVLLPTADDFKKLAEKAKVPDSLGFYQSVGHKLVAIDRGGTLVHEYIHALHEANACASRQVHPIWLREGLATLYESSRITTDGMKPFVDRRVLTLQKAIRKKTLTPLDRLVRLGREAFMADAALHYAEARYLILYLHEKNRLRDWYADYKHTYTKDPTGRKALERALGNRLDVVEREWTEWARKLRMPLGWTRKGQGRLGVEVKGDPRGVKVVGFVPWGAAKKAGRIRLNDVIVKIDGKKTPNLAAFVAVVRSAGANRTVKIELIRHERKMTIIQPLGAPHDEPPHGANPPKPDSSDQGRKKD